MQAAPPATAPAPASRPCLIRGGTVVDGTGAAPYVADVELAGGRIVRIGPALQGDARHTIDARGCIVTPGFVDVHTHYDGQAAWSHALQPSSAHGVTTAILGNCGVGFAPCRPQDRETLVRLMEGVEDIPGIVFAQGLPWSWQTFPEYLDFLGTRAYDMDVGAYLPHAPLRVWAMGERGVHRESATAEDRRLMRTLAAEAVRAGAFGFSTSRSIHHRASDGSQTPMYAAATEELCEIARGVGDAARGLLQVVAGFSDPQQDVQVLRAMAQAGGRPLSVSLAQNHQRPRDWQDILRMLEDANRDGLPIGVQTCGRPVGMLLGLQAALNPFSFHPSYRAIAALPLHERVARLRDPALRERLLHEEPGDDPAGAAPADPRALWRATDLEGLYELGDPPDYEPAPSSSIASRARALGIAPRELAYELLLQDEGRLLLLRPLHNYADGDLEACRTMITHPLATPGLGDGGAHCGYICDASMGTWMLTHWVRDRTRGPRLALPQVVKALAWDGARLLGLRDRGRIAPGLKADINVIDMQRLRLHPPHVAHDLPGGGRRLLQGADGYLATIVCGVVTQSQGRATGELPGRLVRSMAEAA